MDGSGGKESFVLYIYITLQEREVEVLVNYDHPIVEIEARKKKEVDDEQQRSSQVEGEIYMKLLRSANRATQSFLNIGFPVSVHSLARL